MFTVNRNSKNREQGVVNMQIIFQGFLSIHTKHDVNVRLKLAQ